MAEGRTVLGVVQLKDTLKGGIRERFAQLRKMGIRTIMITGDNLLTAGAIAAVRSGEEDVAGDEDEDEENEEEGGAPS